MAQEYLSQLAARLLDEKSDDFGLALKSAEQVVPMSVSYRTILLQFGGAIVFDNGAKFTSDELSPLSDKDGYQTLEVLYGLGNGQHSILRKGEQYSGELLPSFVPIGESSGGNLICVDGNGGVHLWDHESLLDEGTWRIAASIDEFLARLEPDNCGIDNTSGIIDSESFLDF
jgi:hypothetical protein